MALNTALEGVQVHVLWISNDGGEVWYEAVIDPQMRRSRRLRIRYATLDGTDDIVANVNPEKHVVMVSKDALKAKKQSEKSREEQAPKAATRQVKRPAEAIADTSRLRKSARSDKSNQTAMVKPTRVSTRKVAKNHTDEDTPQHNPIHAKTLLQPRRKAATRSTRTTAAKQRNGKSSNLQIMTHDGKHSDKRIGANKPNTGRESARTNVVGNKLKTMMTGNVIVQQDHASTSASLTKDDGHSINTIRYADMDLTQEFSSEIIDSKHVADEARAVLTAACCMHMKRHLAASAIRRRGWRAAADTLQTCKDSDTSDCE